MMALMLRALVLAACLLPLALSASLSSGEDVAAFVKSKIEETQVMVFAKSYCPHCRMTRSLLEKTKKESKDPLDLEIIDLDKLPGSDGPMIQSHLLEISGQRTVPNIFINKKHMGGNSELHQLNTLGKLKSILSTGGSSGNTKSEL